MNIHAQNPSALISRIAFGWLLAAIFLNGLISAGVMAKPLSLHPDNPHYFLFRGQPTILITSAEHYGAVLNLDFDYVKYLDTLARDGLNHTRTFTGAVYVEPQGAFNIVRNTLAPAPHRYLAPWARGATPGYAGGGNQFDLTNWNKEYFARLKDFLTQAGKRGIIVELNLFSAIYGEAQWKFSPLNAANNINNLGAQKRQDVYTLDRSGALLAAQQRFVRKVVAELKDFDNLYYEICNEPWADNIPMEWQRHITDVITETEKSFAEKHLISLNLSNYAERVTNPHPAVSIWNFHYATPPDTVEWNYALNNVIGDNETGFRGTRDAPYRMEGWDFIIAGGGLFNSLDYSFSTESPDGTMPPQEPTPGGGSSALRQQLKTLRDFIYSFDFVRMKPDHSVLKSVIAEGRTARVLSEPGKAYALYLRPISYSRFSARWTGLIAAKYSEEISFQTIANTGARLWINDQMIIDHWTDRAATAASGKIRLEAGKKYTLKLEYFYAGGWGQTMLQWSRANQPKQAIPTGSLYLPDDAGQGLKAEYFSDTELKKPLLTRTDAEVNDNWGTGFSPLVKTTPGDTTLRLDLPAGNYTAEWLDPLTGSLLRTDRLSRKAGERKLLALIPPRYTEDLALRIKRIQGQ